VNLLNSTVLASPNNLYTVHDGPLCPLLHAVACCWHPSTAFVLTTGNILRPLLYIRRGGDDNDDGGREREEREEAGRIFLCVCAHFCKIENPHREEKDSL
jgi:hypothetical protein